MQRWPRTLPVVAAVLLAIAVALAVPALRFTKLLHRATRDALFLESEGEQAREILGAQRAYVAAGWFNYAIIGRFLAYDRDLVAIDGRWPDGTAQPAARDRPILLLGDHKLSDETELNHRYRVQWHAPASWCSRRSDAACASPVAADAGAHAAPRTAMV